MNILVLVHDLNSPQDVAWTLEGRLMVIMAMMIAIMGSS